MQHSDKDTSSVPSTSDPQSATSPGGPSTTNKTSSLRKVPAATFNNDKYARSLRDFSSHSQFDRNLTVEKATFDPTPPSALPVASPPPLDTMAKLKDTTDALSRSSTNTQNTKSNTAPAAAAGTALTTSHSTPASSPSHPSTPSQQQGQDGAMVPSSSSFSKIPAPPHNKRQDQQPLHNKMKPPPAQLKNETDRQSTKKKKRKLPAVNGTATPSEVFHRNLVDAVSNVEDSDEHEQYVYPYRHQPSNSRSKKKKRDQLPTAYRRSTAPSPSSTSTLIAYPSSPQQQQQQQPQQQQQQQQQQPQQQETGTASLESTAEPHRLPRSGGFLTDLLTYQHRSLSSFFKHADNDPQQRRDEERGSWSRHRPKLRSHVMDHPRGGSANSFPQPWAQEISSSDDGDDDDDDDDEDPRYGERMYLLRHPPRSKPQCCGVSCKIIRNTCFSLLAFILAMMFLTVYRAEPLTDVSASMGHVLASDKELIFDLLIKANNWNWWTVRIQEADLSVFAFSELVPALQNKTFGVDPAEYLGSYQQFDQPLSFASSVMSGHRRANASSQIRIKSPGADPSGNQRWSRMIRYPFGLVTRGVLNYRPFPFMNLSPRQSISLCVVLHVDPTTLSITVQEDDDDDHGYCAHYPLLTL